MLTFANGEPFAYGACSYDYRPIAENNASMRIFVPVRVEDIQVEALIDTGGVYFICTPEVADLLELHPDASLGTDRLLIRGVSVPGHLHRVTLQFIAEEGESSDIEITAFVPEQDAHRIWDIPAFLGMQGCLERIRFAIDPGQEQFYFGPIDWEPT